MQLGERLVHASYGPTSPTSSATSFLQSYLALLQSRIFTNYSNYSPRELLPMAVFVADSPMKGGEVVYLTPQLPGSERFRDQGTSGK